MDDTELQSLIALGENMYVRPTIFGDLDTYERCKRKLDLQGPDHDLHPGCGCLNLPASVFYDRRNSCGLLGLLVNTC